MSIRQRFDAWIKGMVVDAVRDNLPRTDDLLYEVVNRMDMGALASLVATNDDLTRAVVSELEDQIDIDDITKKVAGTIDASDVASYMDASDVASNLDIETSEIAERVMDDLDMSSLAEELDYDKLVEAVVSRLKEALTH